MKNKIFLITTLLYLAFSINHTFGQNQNISNGNVFDGEPYLAINPNNSQHMVVAWMGYKVLNKIIIKTRVSFDAGNSWSPTNSLSHINTTFQSADPSLAFDNSGNLFVTYVDYNKAIDSGKILLRKSTDGGLTWGNPVPVIDMHSDPGKKPIDRPWIAVDKSGGVNNGNVYITSMPPGSFGYIPPTYHPYFMVSKNNGTSFLPWKYLDTTNWLSGNLIQTPMPTPCVSSNGIFHAVYPSYLPSQSVFIRYILASSANGGNNFTYKTVLSSANSTTDTLAKKAHLLRVNPANPNHLAFFYIDIKHGDMDVFLTETFNSGSTWSTAIRINDDPIGNNKMQDMVWADFDTDGDLIVSWRDRRNGTDSTYTTASEIWGAFRTNGSSFSTNFRISDNLSSFDSILMKKGNDFMNVRLVNDTLSTVWGEVKSGKLNIWFQRLTKTGVLLSIKNISSENNTDITIFPNPTTSNFMVIGKDIISISIFDTKGKRITKIENKSKTENFNFDIKKYKSGVYFIKINTKNGVVSERVLKR